MPALKKRFSNSGYIYVVTAAVLWGTTGTAQAYAPQNATPMSIGTIRLLIGGAMLLLLAVISGSFERGKQWPLGTTLLAAVSVAAYQPFFFTGVAKTGVAVGTMVAIGSSPVIAGALGFAFEKEHPGKIWLLSTLLAVTGCILLAFAGGEIKIDPLGIVLALGAGASYAIYATTSKRLLLNQLPLAVAAVVFGLGGLFLSPVLFVTDLSWLTQVNGLWSALHLGLIATGLAYILFTKGLNLIPAANAVTLSLAEPLTATVLGVLLLRESLSIGAMMGISLLFCGLFLLATARK